MWKNAVEERVGRGSQEMIKRRTYRGAQNPVCKNLSQKPIVWSLEPNCWKDRALKVIPTAQNLLWLKQKSPYWIVKKITEPKPAAWNHKPEPETEKSLEPKPKPPERKHEKPNKSLKSLSLMLRALKIVGRRLSMRIQNSDNVISNSASTGGNPGAKASMYFFSAKSGCCLAADI